MIAVSVPLLVDCVDVFTKATPTKLAPADGVAHSGAVAPELTVRTCPAVPIGSAVFTLAVAER